MLFYPGAEFVHVGGASHGGRMFTENLRGHLRFLAKHRGAGRGGARPAAAARRAAAARHALPGRARPHVPRRRGLARLGLCAVAALRTARVSRRFHFERLPRELAALPALGLARVLPDTGFGLYLKLAAATLVVLLPGALIARLTGRPSVSATVVWSLTGIFGAGAIVFAVHGSLDLALGLYAVLGAGALVALLSRKVVVGRRRPLGVILLGVLAGVLIWRVAGTLDGDALFHLARVRKLLAFWDLHLRTLDEFKDGGLHPGYAFPLWHLFLAFVARLSGVDAGRVVLHEASMLCPLAFAVVVRVGQRGLPEPWRGVRDAGRDGGAVRARRRPRGRLRPPRAAGDDGAATARAGGDRALLLVRPAAFARRVPRRSPRAGSRSRSSTRPTRCTCSSRSRATSRRGGCSPASS